ncbi:glycerophosphodiester phosphodiesterase [Calditrichota bacterium]
MPDPIFFAHRGASGHYPENTLLAFEKAISAGLTWIETDVYLIEDKLVIIHDDRLERTTNGTGHVAQKSLDYLRSLDAGNGEKIPFLEEALDLIDKRAGMNIEMKGKNTAAATAQVINRYVTEKGWSYDQFLVSSFIHPELLEFKHLCPQVRTGALIAHIPLNFAAFAEKLDIYSIHASIEFLSEEFIYDAHERGLKFFVYTVNHQEDVRRMIEMNVDGIFTDYPELAFPK